MEQRAERLVRRARNGDTEAFTQLILRNEEMLSRVAVSLLHNMEDAADAVQDAVLAAWQALPSLREPRYFRTWLVRILIRCCSQVGASQGRHVHFQLEETLTAAVETPDWDEALDVQAALDTMKPEDKMLLGLFYRDRLSVREIAKALDVSESCVKQRLSRSRKRFRVIFSEKEGLIHGK